MGTRSSVQEVTGIANDAGGNLLVLDGPSKRLLEFDVFERRDATSTW